MDIRPGDIIYGTDNREFVVKDIIGNGNFGIVYEIHDREGNKYALKTLITAFLDSHSLKALVNEGKQAVRLKDDNVLDVLFFHDGNLYSNLPPYIIMEYANSGTLQEFIDNRRKDNQLLTSDELREIYLQLSRGMEAINSVIVHRDIKPDNILISNNLLKIADFGLSKIVGAATRNSTFKGINHIRYCAPEAWNQEDNKMEMDVYSMGIVFYELATLKHPYYVNNSGDIVGMWKRAHLLDIPLSPDKINPNIDIRLSQMIMKMLSKRPNERYDSWKSIINIIMQVANSSIKINTSVKSLVKIANDNYYKTEQDKLKQLEEQAKRIEYIELIQFSINELRSSIESMTTDFNNVSENIKITVTGLGEERTMKYNGQYSEPKFDFDIYRADNINKSIEIAIKPVFENINFDNKILKAWGYAKAPSGIGFNLFLLAENDDIYGSWMTLLNAHNPIATHTDNRPQPFPFDFKELPKEIIHMNSMHIYNTTKFPFTVENMTMLLQEVL